MKLQIMNGLEKVVEVGRDIGRAVKKNSKKALIIASLPFIINNNVDAGYLCTYCNTSFTRPAIVIGHITGAREPEEGFDGNYDASFPPSPVTPKIDIYSKINLDPYRLMIDARPPESTTTINAEISGRLSPLPEPQDAELQFKWGISSGIGNFSWKNIIGELSQRVDDGNGGHKYALIGNYDIKNLVSFSRTIPISINNGITQGDVFFPSHKLDFKFFNHADLNRDRRVDGRDFAIFANNFGRNDPTTLGDNVGSDPNNLDAYADFDRNGIVDFNDLSIFSGKWLWDANDPNTW